MKKALVGARAVLAKRSSGTVLCNKYNTFFMQPQSTIFSTTATAAVAMSVNSTGMVNFRKTDVEGRPYLDVPVTNAVYTYFMKEYAKEGEGFVHGRLNGSLGGLVRLLVEKQPYRQCMLRKKIPGKKLRLVLPDSLKNVMVREETIMAVGAHFESMMRQEFIAFVSGASMCGSSVNFAVEAFLKFYEISPDDWSADTARKCYRDAK